jgi:hypothetical protein
MIYTVLNFIFAVKYFMYILDKIYEIYGVVTFDAAYKLLMFYIV